MTSENPEAKISTSEMEARIIELIGMRSNLIKKIDDLTDIMGISEDFGAGIPRVMKSDGEELSAVESKLRTVLDKLRQIDPGNPILKSVDLK